MLLKEAYRRVLEYLRKREHEKFRERPFLSELISDLSSDSRNYLISAPTGYGKTAITESVALSSFNESSKTLIAYPLRSLIEEQAEILREFLDFVGVGGDVVGTRYMGVGESPYLIHPITLTTVDTLSLMALGLSPEDIHKVFESLSSEEWFRNLGHYLFSWSSVFSSAYLILDEIHLMYDTSKSLSFLRALINLCEYTGVRVILMTATLPRSFEQVLSDKVVVRRFTRESDAGFYEERLSKKYRVELLRFGGEGKLESIKKILSGSRFSKALVVFNTVEDAINFYRLIDGRKLLIHSRFSVEDRKSKLRELRALKDSAEKLVLVSTQAVEAGVDFTSDLLITEVAPPISLIQRFGRFLRREEKFGSAYVWFEEEGFRDTYYKVYDAGLVKRTIDYLSSNSDLNLHVGYEDFLDSVYSEVPAVNQELVRDVEGVFLNLLESSRSALELLIRLEGSFVRDGNLITVVTEDGVEVNVSYEYLMRLRREGKCVECPGDRREILIKSLSGHRFGVRVTYDREVGLA